MERILWRWGGFSLYSYTALVGLGIIAATAYVLWKGVREGYDPITLVDGVLWTLFGGIVGARAAYVVAHWPDFAGEPAQLLTEWGGGLVFQGGVAVGTLSLAVYTGLKGLPFLRFADLAASAVPLGQAFGWIGALAHGANYGLIMRSPLSMWLPDLYGVYGPRFPTQLIASLASAALFLLLCRWSRWSLRPGVLATACLLIGEVIQFLLEFTRADEALGYVGILRITQVAGALAVLAAGLWLLWLRVSLGTLRSEG